MAAYEGFLTSVYAGKDIFRPTFFELIAQEQLSEVFRPAVRFVVDIWRQRLQRHSSFLGRLLNSWDLFYTLFLLFLEGYHLRIHGATFAEHFFGLRRLALRSDPVAPLEALAAARQSRRQKLPPLTARQQAASLMLVVILPWLSSKCEERFQQMETVHASHVEGRVNQMFYRIYPIVHATRSLASFVYGLLYLLEQTDVWSPWLHLLGLKLARHFPEPPEEEEEVKTLARRIQDVAKLGGQASLWGTVYVLQFLQWWYQREHLLQPGRPRKAPPPPPVRFPYPESSAGQRLVLLPEDPTICPLCHRQRQNPAMSCGGYAFCYTCLVPHVRDFGHCPITGQRMKLEEIRRIRDEG